MLYDSLKRVSLETMECSMECETRKMNQKGSQRHPSSDAG